MDKKTVVKALAALAHPARLDVFRQLVVAGHEGMTPKFITEGLNIPPTTLSFHLKELAMAGLVTQEHVGRQVVYRAAYGQMDGLVAFLTENCCQGMSEGGDAEGSEGAATCQCGGG